MKVGERYRLLVNLIPIDLIGDCGFYGRKMDKELRPANMHAN